MTETWLRDAADADEPEAPGGEPRRVVVPPRQVTQRPNPPDPHAAATNQWTPLGPSTTLRGQAMGRPRVSGRVRALAASDDGQRVYAGSALGGVWYSGDGGNRWTSLDFYASTRDQSGQLRDSNALSVGAVAVRFVDPASDLVLVGTGERPANPLVNDELAVQGIGIRVATGPAQTVLASGPASDPWTLEATNLTGAAVSRLAFDRFDPAVVWAATSVGLFRRPPAGDRSSWEFVDATLGRVWVTDVVVVPGLANTPERERVYAVSRSGTLVRSTDGQQWTPVTLPPDPSVAAAKPAKFVALAPGNDPARPVVWVLGGGPRLWRVDADTAEIVTGLPFDLFGEDVDQTDYDLAVAVHPSTQPAHRDLVAVGGSLGRDANNVANAGLYAGRVTRDTGGTLTFPATTFPPATSPAPPEPKAPAGLSGLQRGEWIGLGVHADVHAIVWVGTGVPATMWVGCDGGVFRSASDGARGSFRARNTGLNTIQVNRIAQHPRVAGLVLAGTQDNGAVLATGGTLWQLEQQGDAGGVALNPARPAESFGQSPTAKGPVWWASTDADADAGVLAVFSPPAARAAAAAGAWQGAQLAERKDLPFTSTVAVVTDDARATGTQLVLGTRRVWYRDGVTLAAAATAADGRTGWVTLPTGTDPYAPSLALPAAMQDLLDSAITGLEWAGPDRLYVLSAKCVYALRRTAGAWQPVETLYDQNAVHRNRMRQLPFSGQVPDDVDLLEIAVHDPDREPHGSLYLGVRGDRDQHNLWWYDGTSAWRHTGLELDSPVHALVVDPADPTVVFAGSDVGVVRGVGAFPASGDPTWTWETYSDGLPEAVVVDLAVLTARDGAPRLLRAGTAGRGVWEVAIDGSTLGPTAYLRAHALDTRRGPTPLGGAEDVTSRSRTQVRLDASPDIRLWRADSASAPVPGRLPVDRTSPAYDVWLLQSALKAGGEDVPVDGTWSDAVAPAFAHRVTALGKGPPEHPTPQQVWDALWAGNRLPFDSTPPDAADLVAHLRERPDLDAKGARASCLADDGRARIFVTVHGRHWHPIDGAAVQVALLRAPFGRHANLAGTAPLPEGWAARLLSDRTAALVGEWMHGTPWEYVDLAHPFRPLPAALDPDNPQVAVFDADLSGPAWAMPGYLLLAVVVCDDDPLTATETDVARLVATDHHVAARSVRRSHAAVPPVPNANAIVAGMDQGNYAGLPTMTRAWEQSNLTWTGLYLDSPRPVPGELAVPPGVGAGHNRLGGTPGHPAGSWMSAFPQLWPDWGIAPIYWGQQDPANAQGPFDLRPQVATANAEDAAAKAAAAGIPAGAVVYLDWEAGGVPSAAALTYLRTFAERLGELGFRPGLYAHAAAASALRREVPGLFVWAVQCEHQKCATVPTDRSLADERVWYARVPMPAADPDAVARQWALESTQPVGSALLPFGNINQDVSVVADPAFPERRPRPALIRVGALALLPPPPFAANGAVTAVRVRFGKVAAVTWTPGVAGAGTTGAPEAGVAAATAAHWWNPFTGIAGFRAPGGPDTPVVDWVAGLGFEHLVDPDKVVASLEAGPDGWRPQMLERGPWGWRFTTVPDGGLVVDPVAGVTAVARGGGRPEILVVTEDGTPATASVLPGTRDWLPLARVCPPGTAPATVTCRPVLVTRGVDDVDAVWLGRDGRLWAAHSTGAGAWAAPQQIGDPDVAVHPLGALGAVSVAVDRVDVTYLGRSGAGSPWTVHVTAWTAADGWGGAAHTAAIGGATPLSPLSRLVVGSRDAAAAHVLAVAATGALLITTRSAPDQPWTDLAAVGGTPPATGGPLQLARVEAAQVTSDGALVVAAFARDGRVWLTRFDPGTAAWSTFEAVTALGPP